MLVHSYEANSSAKVTFTSTAKDIVDGSITPACNPLSGSIFAMDTKTVTCTTTDARGNTGTASFKVAMLTPLQSIQKLIALKDSMNLDKGNSNSLGAKLNAAYQSLNSGHSDTAKDQLNAFIHEVDAQAGKKLTIDQAHQLRIAAQNIINAIG